MGLSAPGEILNMTLKQLLRQYAKKADSIDDADLPVVACDENNSGLSADWHQWPEELQQKARMRALEIMDKKRITKRDFKFQDALALATEEIRASDDSTGKGENYPG